MAAVSQPGSRAGLITALVIFVILFFVSAIFWIVNATENKEKERQLKQLTDTYAMVITRAELASNGNDIRTMQQEEPGGGKPSFFSIATRQRDELSKLINGQTGVAVAKVVKDATDLVQDLGAKQLKAAGVQTPGVPLTNVISSLAKAVAEKQRLADSLAQQVKTMGAELQQRDLMRATETESHRKALEAAKAEAAAATKESEAYRQGKDVQLASLEKNYQADIESKRKLVEELTTQLKTKTEEGEKTTKDNQKLIEKLGNLRPTNMADTAVRRADGKVIQIGRNNVVYINLGLGQQITPGMTFEIYDKWEGVPALNSDDEHLPVGKGSLEVVHVSSGSSECRVIKTQPGNQIVEGDVIANLVYDPNVKWAFKVYGDFDIDQNKVASTQETDIVKRLIVQWGGQLTEKINMDTDFLVLGKEPVVPNYTKEQIESSPLLKFERDKAEEALKAYEAVKTTALELHIPVLSQNRFLYMIGFYDQAKK